jgi:hypothetical protein
VLGTSTATTLLRQCLHLVSGHGKTVELGAVLVERCVANNFGTDGEEARGSTADAACTPKTKMVKAKLEMVCGAGVFHSGTAVPGVC